MLQSIINGLVQGSIYAIIALGYTMVYGILLLINFAHGEILMIGAYVGVLAMAAFTWGGQMVDWGILPCIAASLVAAMAVSGIYGFMLERIAYRPLRHAPTLSPLISAIGMSIFLQNYVRIAQGNAPLYVPTNEQAYADVFGESNNIALAGSTVGPVDLLLLMLSVSVAVGLYSMANRALRTRGATVNADGEVSPRRPLAAGLRTAARSLVVAVPLGLAALLLLAYDAARAVSESAEKLNPGAQREAFMKALADGGPFGAATLTPLDIFIGALCVALMVGLYTFVQRSRLGKAMRATSQDKVMAGLVGISIDRVISITFVIGSVLAAVAGILMALYSTQAKFDMGFMAGMKAFTAAVLGGIGNLPGAMLGGVILGLAESLGIHFISAAYKEVYAFVVLLIVLTVRPKGIMGEQVSEKV